MGWRHLCYDKSTQKLILSAIATFNVLITFLFILIDWEGAVGTAPLRARKVRYAHGIIRRDTKDEL